MPDTTFRYIRCIVSISPHGKEPRRERVERLASQENPTRQTPLFADSNTGFRIEI